MKTFAFVSKAVVLEDPEGQSHFVGLADDAANPNVYLIITRAKEYEAQDIVLGIATYHVEFCGEGQSGYGGVKEACLSPEGLDLIFSEAGVEYLDGLESMSVKFQVDGRVLEKIKKVLLNIFEGSSCAFRAAA